MRVCYFDLGDTMKSKKVNVSLSLDWEIVEKLRMIAEEDDRALSSCINLILRDYLRTREEQQGPGHPLR